MSGLGRCGSWWRQPLMRMVLAVSVAAIGAAVAPGIAAESWQGQLDRGGELSVDPATRRAFRTDGAGPPRPMWDGVHRLEDGSTVTIRDGVAVPTEEMLDAWQGPVQAVPEEVAGPCAELVARVCGRGDECARTAPCFHARQLLSTERAEQRLAPLGAGQRPATATTESCRTALAETTFFPPCAAGVAAGVGDACQTLVGRVCGEAGDCADSPSCRLARQLLAMEADAAQAGEGAAALAAIAAQCAEAAAKPVFVPCP